MSRMLDRGVIINKTRMYKKSSFLKNRNLSYITHYSMPTITYPSEEQIGKFTTLTHIWRTGDKFYKLADEHYGDPEFWWAIPWFNKKNLESDFKIGDIVHIPLPLEEVVKYFRGETSTGY